MIYCHNIPITQDKTTRSNIKWHQMLTTRIMLTSENLFKELHQRSQKVITRDPQITIPIQV